MMPFGSKQHWSYLGSGCEKITLCDGLAQPLDYVLICVHMCVYNLLGLNVNTAEFFVTFSSQSVCKSNQISTKIKANG